MGKFGDKYKEKAPGEGEQRDGMMILQSKQCQRLRTNLQQKREAWNRLFCFEPSEGTDLTNFLISNDYLQNCEIINLCCLGYAM